MCFSVHDAQPAWVVSSLLLQLKGKLKVGNKYDIVQNPPPAFFLHIHKVSRSSEPVMQQQRYCQRSQHWAQDSLALLTSAARLPHILLSSSEPNTAWWRKQANNQRPNYCDLFIYRDRNRNYLYLL